MEKKSFKQRERERREAEILLAAGQMIRERGYAHLNMDALAEAVGISKPTLYQHFKSKEEIVARSVIQAAHEMETFVSAQTEGTPMEKLESVLRYMVHSMLTPDAFPAALVANEVMRILDEHPDVQHSMITVSSALRQWVDEGKSSGQIDANMPTDVIMGAFFTLMEIAEPARLNPRVEPLPPEVLTHSVLKLFRRGVSPDD